MKTRHNIVIGDSRWMKEILDESIHLVITSPPYWQIKDYGQGRQIGFDHSYEDYINNMNLVWKECHRVLNRGCRLCVNIGDQFARSLYYGRYKVIPIRTEIIKFCESIGFDYMGAIIWQKVTTTNTTGGATIMGSFPYPRNGVLKIDYEFILIFKKYGKAPKVSKDIKAKSKLSKEEWNQYFTGHWQFPGEKQRAHLAMFPEELPRRLIKMYSFVGDTVLDPFLGSGTTALAAKNLGRNSWGYEVNESFIPVIKDKVSGHQESGSGEDGLEIVLRGDVDFDAEKAIEKLPYIFRDPVEFDRKKDPKKYRFGSKIDHGTDYNRENYYRVKQVLSSECVLLNNDQKIRLIGVKENPDHREEAIQYLSEKTKGQQVYIKYDVKAYDADNNLLCNLYLKNKTFVNNHLIKSGLVDRDPSTT